MKKSTNSESSFFVILIIEPELTIALDEFAVVEFTLGENPDNVHEVDAQVPAFPPPDEEPVKLNAAFINEDVLVVR